MCIQSTTGDGEIETVDLTKEKFRSLVEWNDTIMTPVIRSARSTITHAYANSCHNSKVGKSNGDNKRRKILEDIDDDVEEAENPKRRELVTILDRRI